MKKFFKPNALNFFLLGLVILLALLGIGFILELFGMDGAQMTLIPLMGIPIILFFISGVYFLVYFIFSLSNNVVLGDTELFQYDIPAFLNFITKPFRSSGRFIWLPFYLIYCFLLAL